MIRRVRRRRDERDSRRALSPGHIAALRRHAYFLPPLLLVLGGFVWMITCGTGRTCSAAEPFGAVLRRPGEEPAGGAVGRASRTTSARRRSSATAGPTGISGSCRHCFASRRRCSCRASKGGGAACRRRPRASSASGTPTACCSPPAARWGCRSRWRAQSRRTYAAVVVTLGLGSTLIFMASRSYVFHEAIIWGSAFAWVLLPPGPLPAGPRVPPATWRRRAASASSRSSPAAPPAPGRRWRCWRRGCTSSLPPPAPHRGGMCWRSPQACR